MKAAIVERYGPPEAVVVREVPTPEPGPGEVRVRIVATTVNSGDARVRALRVPGGMSLLMRFGLGFTRPRQQIGGFEGAGVIDRVGPGVGRFRVGDRVVGSHGFKFGLHAEYAVFAETDALTRIPDGVGFEQAVAVLFGGTTSLMFFEAGKLAAGESILINGASGAVGVMAVQLARHRGAEVTAVCSSRNAELVRSLGADHVIAYDREDFTKNGRTYDVIMDNHGNAPFSRVRNSLRPGGRFLLVIFETLWEMISAKWNRQVIEVEENEAAITPETYSHLLDLLARGVIRPVIDSTYPLERIAEAHRRVDTGHKTGSVVVTVGAP